jgi:starvation-inducible DNA-binding protein
MENQVNPDLAKKLAYLLSDVVAMSSITQGHHWKVRGQLFYQFHEFFAEIYSDISSAIDPLAENIRKLGFDAPYLISDFAEMTCIKQTRISGDAMESVKSIAQANLLVIKSYLEAFEIAEACNQPGIADFLAGRHDMHQKWQWQLESTLGIR